ncbi:MAG TPA: 2'-5' RNA ligase family protein [Pseudonocardiaceae bacterium]|jgi:hypothetical protein
MPKIGQTGVIIPVPAADELLATVAARYPGTVREGVSAHLSVLYPFIAAEKIDERLIGVLSGLFAGQAPISVSFAAVRRSAGFVYLPPEPADRIAQLIGKVRQGWPDVLPYAGVYGDVEPHVTVAICSSEQTAARIERETGSVLPISAQLSEAWLVVFDGQWSVRARFEFDAAHQHINWWEDAL